MKWYAQQNIAIRYIRFSEQRILLGFMSYSVNPQQYIFTIRDLFETQDSYILKKFKAPTRWW